MSPQELAKVIAFDLEEIEAPDFLKHDFELLIEKFHYLSEKDSSEDVAEEFDTLMTWLYDVAEMEVNLNRDKFLWVGV